MSARAGRIAVLAAALAAAGLLAGCAGNPPPATTAPKYPDFPQVDVPAGVSRPSDAVRDLNDAWQRLQAGDVTGARQEYAALLKRAPEFYPAETGLGFVALAARDYKEASARFASATARNGRYLPALLGRVDAAIGLGDDDDGAIEALETIVKIQPANTSARSRLEVLRVRRVQAEIDEGRKAREAGRLDDAARILGRALAATPDNAVILREVALVDLARGTLPAAVAHARQSTQLDPGDPEAFAVLGEALEKSGDLSGAGDAYDRALALDPRPAWRDKRAALGQKAEDAARPPEFRAIAGAPRATRGDAAALIGSRLGDLLTSAPRKLPVVVTDLRGQWAAPWILPVAQAGVMDVMPNHTFQAAGTIRRLDLASIVSNLLSLVAAERPVDLSRWRAARPKLADVPPTHAAYAAIALAVACGAMTTDADRFVPDRLVTGAELTAAVARLRQIAR